VCELIHQKENKISISLKAQKFNRLFSYFSIYLNLVENQAIELFML